MIKKASRWAKIIGALPFVRKVSLTGSLAEGLGTEQSDIDLFVQVVPGRLYLTRLLVTLFAELFGVRRRADKIAGRICLNWFASFDGPLKQGRPHQVLWQFEGSERLFEKLLSGRLGDKLEAITKIIQQKRFRADPRTLMPGSQVRFSDKELGFHPPKGS